MHGSLRLVCLLLLCGAAPVTTWAAVEANGVGDFWLQPSARSIPGAVRSSRESRMHLDRSGLSQYLRVLPAADSDGSLPMQLPMPDGSKRQFEVSRSLVMSSGLAAKFPELQTFQGYATDGSGARLRFEINEFGFGAMMFAPEGVSLIESDSGDDDYVSFARERRSDLEPFQCGVHTMADTGASGSYAKSLKTVAPKAAGPILRTYRTAIAATGEYTATFGGTVPKGVGAVVSAVNRINQIYETELAIRLVLVPDNDLIIYTDASTDPYTNNDGFEMLDENQANLTLVIGNADYDFGHVFSTGGGGVAGVGVVCVPGEKAVGVTGRGSPTNDPFWVDYVAHEMGHQLDGPHTFNSSTSNCSGGNRDGGAAYEVGSGSTIMAYAGICGGEDLQPNSDPYFHVSSLETLQAFTQSGAGGTCGTTTPTGNTAPVLAVVAPHTIPTRTPFALTASATDAQSHPITYSWEQFNLGPASTVASVNVDNGTRPIFRSFEATTSPTRLFPRLQNILSNTQTIGEVMPTVARANLTFRVTARDNRAGGGGVSWTSVVLNVVDSGAGSGFEVTAPNTATSWASGSTQAITWNVAGTTANGINCANVDIAWSTDGGQTFPNTLATATANDGAANITVPAQATTAGRVRVSCSDNIFFDINNADVTVTGGNAAPVLVMGGSVTYTTNAPAVIINAAATIADSDSPNFNGGALTLTLSNNSEANDRLDIRNEGNGAGQIGVSGATINFAGTPIGSFIGGVGIVPLVVTFNASATPAAAQAVLRNARFGALNDIAGTLPRTLEARVSDGDGGSSVVATRTINIALNPNPIVALIDDGDADNLVPVSVAINYVVAFSKDVDLASISAADFNNAGTAPITVGAISEPTAGTVNVAITPTSNGTVRLRLPASATILDSTGLNVLVPAMDNDTLTAGTVVNDAIFANSFE